MPVSKSGILAREKYNEKTYDRFLLTVKKGRKAELQAHAQERGESLNGFVNRAIDETVERDGSRIVKVAVVRKVEEEEDRPVQVVIRKVEEEEEDKH